MILKRNSPPARGGVAKSPGGGSEPIVKNLFGSGSLLDRIFHIQIVKQGFDFKCARYG